MALSPVYSAEQQLRVITESLTTRERTYADARMAGTPPVAAGRVAGLKNPESDSQRLESDDRLRTYLQMAMKYQVTQANITRDDVLNGLMEALPYCTSATEIVKVWTEVGKIIGAYAPKKVDVNQTVNDPSKLRRMSEEELLEQAGDIVDADYEPLDFTDEETANDE
jgi:hypothetical protein